MRYYKTAGFSLPRKFLEKIDAERGDVSRKPLLAEDTPKAISY